MFLQPPQSCQSSLHFHKLIFKVIIMNTANLTSKYNSLPFLPPEFMINGLRKTDRLHLSEEPISDCFYRNTISLTF